MKRTEEFKRLKGCEAGEMFKGLGDGAGLERSGKGREGTRLEKSSKGHEGARLKISSKG